MKKLERSEMKNLKGGLLYGGGGGGIVMSQSGYELMGSNCFCDFHYTYSDGSTLDYCHIPCASTCCNPGYGCSFLLTAD